MNVQQHELSRLIETAERKQQHYQAILSDVSSANKQKDFDTIALRSAELDKAALSLGETVFSIQALSHTMSKGDASIPQHNSTPSSGLRFYSERREYMRL